MTPVVNAIGGGKCTGNDTPRHLVHFLLASAYHLCECYDVPNATTRGLASRRRQLVARLRDLGPVLRASILERYTTCGKAGCKCMQGEKHGPAYYLTVSYAKGKTRQVYVPKDLLPVVERWVGNYHQAMTVLEELSDINLELIRRKEPDPTP